MHSTHSTNSLLRPVMMKEPKKKKMFPICPLGGREGGKSEELAVTDGTEVSHGGAVVEKFSSSLFRKMN